VWPQVEVTAAGHGVIEPRDRVIGRMAGASATDRREVEQRDGARSTTSRERSRDTKSHIIGEVDDDELARGEVVDDEPRAVPRYPDARCRRSSRLGMATGISPTGISRTFCPPKEQNVPVLIPGNVRGEGFPPSPSPRGYFSPDGGPVPD
jgi:hypothetical protein